MRAEPFRTPELPECQGAAEFEVLRLVAQANPPYGQIATVLKTDVDWAVLMSLAAAHSVRPQLIYALRQLNWASVPAETKQSLLEFLRFHKVRSLLVTGELIRVSDLLSQNSIRFATFKGPSLAAGLYGDLSLREYNDIDLVVEEQQIARAEALLASLGYRSVLGSSAFRGAFLAYQKQYMFTKEQDLSIDLHWEFTGTAIPFPVASVEIWNTLEQVNFGNRVVPTLGRADLALFLAGHGAKEGWRCLGWVSDFGMFIEKNQGLDWRNLIDRAQRRGCGQSVLVGCELAARLLGTRVDTYLLRLVENNPQIRVTAKALARRIRNSQPAQISDHEFGDLELCENWKQKARAIGKLLITRTVSDYISMPLPRPLWRIYHVTRPFRLAGKVIKSLGAIGPHSQERRRKLLSRIPQV